MGLKAASLNRPIYSVAFPGFMIGDDSGSDDARSWQPILFLPKKLDICSIIGWYKTLIQTMQSIVDDTSETRPDPSSTSMPANSRLAQ
jgi:hypothetical protein